MNLVCGAGLSIIDFSDVQSAMLISNGATVTLEGCTFTRNSVPPGGIYTGIIIVEAVHTDYETNDQSQQDTILRLQQCILENNDADHDLVAIDYDSESSPSLFDAVIYSDVGREVFTTLDLTLDPSLPLAEVPASRPGIDTSTSWFVELQRVRRLCTHAMLTCSTLCIRGLLVYTNERRHNLR